MPRFVILEHRPTRPDGKPLHWDLMLEEEGGLRTWELAQLPSAGGSVDAVELPVHRIEYLDYEGPISGDRGEVSRVDKGEYEWVSEREPLEIVMTGERFRGRMTISRVGDTQRWIVRLGESNELSG